MKSDLHEIFTPEKKKIIDHIVIGRNKEDYVSFMDKGWIKGV